MIGTPPKPRTKDDRGCDERGPVGSATNCNDDTSVVSEPAGAGREDSGRRADRQLSLFDRDREAELRIAARVWVEASCRAQGIPIKITDGRVLRVVATLLGASSPTPVTPTPWAPSHAPYRLDTRRIEPVVAAPARPDDDVVHDGRDDRVTTRKRKRQPALPQSPRLADVVHDR